MKTQQQNWLLIHNQQHDDVAPLCKALKIPQFQQLYIKAQNSNSQKAVLLNNGDIEKLSAPDKISQLAKSTENFPLIISNGNFLAKIEQNALQKINALKDYDLVSVTVRNDLSAGAESARITEDGRVIGFTRQYESALMASVPSQNWPHHVFLNKKAIGTITSPQILNQDFPAFIKHCQKTGLKFLPLQAAGKVYPLKNPKNILKIAQMQSEHKQKNNCSKKSIRILGNLIAANDAKIQTGTVIIGPSLLAAKSNIGKACLISKSIIGPEIEIPDNSKIQNRLLLTQDDFNSNTKKDADYSAPDYDIPAENSECLVGSFRTWPSFSYMNFFKRIGDILFSCMVILLFAPFIPIIALAIKINSPGPVFYRARRQGLHGKEFGCIKFRTMFVGADNLQNTLRSANQVDGPQFKIDDDPRISTVGAFLRDTSLDELPQFFNVLIGQMSVVGPRPSPKHENLQSPFWRDARLSVRPGITGLWQISRTRQTGYDFPEWVAYDTEYVRKASLKFDLWICWKTFIKLLRDFVRQF